jgi:sulfatase modifying factor 1
VPAVTKSVVVTLLASTLAIQGDRATKSSPLEHEWREVDGRSWQIVAPTSEDPAVTDEAEGTRGDCPVGMVEVRGQMKTVGSVDMLDELQKTSCIEWIDRDFPERCALYDEQKWRELSRDLPTKPMHFCIDRFEYPDRKGDYPVIAVTWREANELCGERSERLCSEEEWTFACEGDDALPYPEGYGRDADACVIDRPWRFVDERALGQRDSPNALAEIDRLWQGEPSGSHPRCRSPFGVYDMTGNVDEWTRSVEREGYASILKGGYWGPVRTRCRPSTRAHDEDFYFYQQGFRCCASALSDGEPNHDFR